MRYMMKHMMLSAGFLAVLGGCNMAQDGTAGENDKYTIGAPGFDDAAFGRRDLEKNMPKLERVGRTDCGAFALELYLPRDFSHKDMVSATSLETEFKLFWVVRVTEKLRGVKLSVTLPTSYDDPVEWYAERLAAKGQWVRTIAEETVPVVEGNSYNDVVYKFSGKDLSEDIVLPTSLTGALSGILSYADSNIPHFYPGNFIPGRYRIHMGQFSAQVEGQELCSFDTTVWEVNIRR